jgi:hypothetical protein
MCGICRNPFDGCPPESKFPGDDSPVVWGTCGHAFHLQVGLLRLVLVLVVVLVWAQLLFGDKAACCCV